MLGSSSADRAFKPRQSIGDFVPVRFRADEHVRFGSTLRIRVERTCGHDHHVASWREMRSRTAAALAEANRETLRVWDFVETNLRFAANPAKRVCLVRSVGAMRAAARAAAASAVTVHHANRGTFDLERDVAT